jgi:hypothetical protein
MSDSEDEHEFGEYPHLQFEAGSTAQQRFTSLRRKKVKPNTVISWEWLQEVGERARAEDIIVVGSPWEMLFTMGWPAHRELTLEVYCTFVFQPRAPDDPELDEDDIAEGRVPAEVTFRMFGVVHRMSLRRFAVISNLYTEEQTLEPIYTTAIFMHADDDLHVWWPAIGEFAFGAGSRTSHIRDPLYRYMHRMIATSITGRGKGTEKVSAIDLFYLRCLLTHTPCHLARGLADYIAGYYHRQERGALVGGNIVAQIAAGLGYTDAMAALPLPAVAPRVGGKLTGVGMRIVRRFPDGQWRLVTQHSVLQAWVPEPLVDPPPLVAGQVQLEQVDEQPDGVEQPVGVQPPVEPPQHPPRVYHAVRLPAATLDMIQRTEAIGLRNAEMLEWVIAHIVDDRQARGMPLLSPPPRRFGHDGASTSGAGGSGAGGSGVGGSGADSDHDMGD